MALLGTTYLSSYTKGKKDAYEVGMGTRVKDMTPIFYLIKYLCDATVSKLCEKLGDTVIARYSDSFTVSRRYEKEFLIEKLIESEVEVFSRMSQNIFKYHGLHLHDLFTPADPDDEVMLGTFDLHEQQIDSLLYSYDGNGHRAVSFYRQSKDGRSVDRVTYRGNENKNIFES